MPPVKAGINQAPVSVPAAAPSARQRAWLEAERPRLHGEARTGAGSEAISSLVPEGQGDVPWHQIFDFRITDALVGRIDYSTGNLMLAATDFDIAEVGQKLRLTRTYNALRGKEPGRGRTPARHPADVASRAVSG